MKNKKKKTDERLDYIRKYLAKGICIYSYREKIILKYPYDRDHRGWKKYKTETVCPVPLNRQQRKDAKKKVLDLAQKRANEFWEYDKFDKQPEWMKPRKPPFKTVALEYMKEKGIDTKKPPKALRDCIQKFKNRLPDDITAIEIENFYKELLNTKVIHHVHGKPKTLDRTLGLGSVKERKNFLRKIYIFGKKHGLVESAESVLDAEIPMDEVKKQNKTHEPKQKAISPSEFLLIYEQLPKKSEVRDMALIAFMTGMRAGEIIGLEAKRIITSHEHPHIELDKQHVSRGAARIVPLMPPLVSLLEEKTRLRIGKVFKTKRYRSTWNRTVQKAGVMHHKGNIRFHDLRSSFITLAKDAGLDAEVRMKIVGHTIPDDDELVISEIHMEYYDPLKEKLHGAIMQVYDYLLETEERILKIAVNQ